MKRDFSLSSIAPSSLFILNVWILSTAQIDDWLQSVSAKLAYMTLVFLFQQIFANTMACIATRLAVHNIGEVSYILVAKMIRFKRWQAVGSDMCKCTPTRQDVSLCTYVWIIHHEFVLASEARIKLHLSVTSRVSHFFKSCQCLSENDNPSSYWQFRMTDYSFIDSYSFCCRRQTFSSWYLFRLGSQLLRLNKWPGIQTLSFSNWKRKRTELTRLWT